MSYISAESVAAIRNELKKKFPTLKFSVRRDGYSGVRVKIVSGKLDFSDIFNGRGYADINIYWLQNYGKWKSTFEAMVEIMKNAPARAGTDKPWYDNSDAMIDYFNTAWYMNLSVGDWNKPYIKTA